MRRQVPQLRYARAERRGVERAAGKSQRPVSPRQLPPRPAFQQPRPRWAPGLLLLLPGPQVPKAPPTPLAATATSPSSAATVAVSSIASAPRTTSCARCPASSRRHSTLLSRPMICGRPLRRARTGQHVRRTYSAAPGELRAEGLRGASPAAPAPMRSAAACAPSAVLRRRSGR